jgi:two-component system response regulator NreC
MPLDLHLAPSSAETSPVASAASPQIRVVLAEGHPLMRRSLRTLLDGEPDIEVIGEANDLVSAMLHVQEQQPQVLILDLGMPGGSSIAAISQLRECLPETQIVASTMEDNPAFAKRALAAGALGFVLKERADEEVPEAVRATVRGQEYISPLLAPRLDDIERSLTQDKLSAREVKVTRLIAQGHTSAAVARMLRISPRTVEAHRAHIFTKLGLSTRAELVHYALGHGLLG